jgi:dTDP-4-amino-4,6-dideoxygalactose transaminase
MKKIPLFKVLMSDNVAEYVVPTLLSGYIGEGAKVVEFESMIGDYIGNKNVVAVNSCTSAITMALRLAGVNHGSFVITTPMTCLATNEPVLSLGAIPIFADIDARTGNISVDDVRRLLRLHTDSKGRLTKPIKAIIGVHWGGYPCDVIALQDLANDYGISFIEDAAQAFGAEINGMKIGNTGSDFVCFSFQAIKHLTTGDGGALVTRTSEHRERAVKMRWFGLDRSLSTSMRCDQDPKEYGYKWHMNDIAASIGICNFDAFKTSLYSSQLTAYTYNKEFKDLFGLQHDDLDVRPSYWLYTVRVDDADKFIAYMADNNVECSKVHSRNDKKLIFVDYINYADFAASFKGVDSFDKHHVCIPCGYWLDDSSVNYIIKVVKEYNNG